MLNISEAIGELFTFEKAGDIAAFFKKEGIKGHKGHEEACPIANWIIEKTGCPVEVNGEHIFNYSGMVRVDDDFTEWDTVVEENSWGHTQATYDFINEFDSGAYPELEYSE